MLIAHVIFTVAPENRSKTVERLTRDIEEITAMPGCMAFVPFADPTGPDRVGVMHEWETAEAFKAYISSESFKAFGSDIRPLMTAPPISRRYEASLIESVN